MDRFAQLLYDLSKEIELDLYPDENRICQLNYHDLLDIQISLDEVKEQAMIATFICEIPPGKYREKLLKTALMANNEYPRPGTFAYSERNNNLTLFTYIPTEGLTGEKLYQAFSELVEVALLWKDAVENGKPLPSASSKGGGDSMFGLKP